MQYGGGQYQAAAGSRVKEEGKEDVSEVSEVSEMSRKRDVDREPRSTALWVARARSKLPGGKGLQIELTPATSHC